MTAYSGKPTRLPARAYPSYTAPGMYHTVKLSYSVDNPGEVRSTAVYPQSWIHVNFVRKVANATLQLNTPTLKKWLHSERYGYKHNKL